MLKFSKYQGAGNDFVMIDNRQVEFDKTQKNVAKLCHRRFGIGADGLILLEQAEQPDEDFKMVYYNADGSESTMCGNGGRCIVQFAHDLGLIKEQTVFTAIDGRHEAELKGDLIALKMIDVPEVTKAGDAFILNTGSPHYVKFVHNIDELDVEKEGKAIRYSDRFKAEGINVNFIEIGTDLHKIRTYERGVEAETYACGTGTTAAAIALYISGHSSTSVNIKAVGGQLKVNFTPQNNGFTDVWLTGPAQCVFEGLI